MKKEHTNAFGKVYLTVEFDETNRWMYTNWIGVVPTENVIEGCQAIIEFLRKHPCPHQLNDNRDMMGSWSEANDWIAREWVPQVQALGLRRLAHLVSPSLFSQASAAEMEARLEDQLEMRLFTNVAQAKAWLRAA